MAVVGKSSLLNGNIHLSCCKFGDVADKLMSIPMPPNSFIASYKISIPNMLISYLFDMTNMQNMQELGKPETFNPGIHFIEVHALAIFQMMNSIAKSTMKSFSKHAPITFSS